MKIMAIDYGDAHTGIAISDYTETLAGYSDTLHSRRQEEVLSGIQRLIAEHGVQLLVLFVLEQPGLGQCLVRQFKRQFLRRQKKPPPGLAAQCEIAPGFIEVSLEAAILNGPLSCKNMGKGFDHQILCLVDIAQHAVDVKGQRVAIPLHQQLSGSFVSGQILPVGCFV